MDWPSNAPQEPSNALQEPRAWTSRDLRAGSHWRSAQQLVVSDQLVHCWRGAYFTNGSDLLTRLQALQLAVGVPLIACHCSAAALHGFGVLDDGRLHVTAADGRSLRRRSGVVMHQWVPRHDLAPLDGFRATAAADTAVDIACTSSEIDLLAVLDAAMQVGVSRADLLRAVESARGRRGITKVKTWILHADPRAQSPMESRTRYRVVAAGLPIPGLQVRVDVPGGVRYLDLGWRRKRVGLEFDGEEFDTGDGRMARDRQRHNELMGEGWTIVYATAVDVFRYPESFLARLRALLA